MKKEKIDQCTVIYKTKSIFINALILFKFPNTTLL